jgi:subtilisin family serine protease
LILFFGHKLNAQNPTFNWAKSFGAAATTCISYSTKSDHNGNVITVGVFTGVVDFDPGPGTFTMSSIASSNDIFILKLDGNGNFVWAKQIGGVSQNDQASELITDAAGNDHLNIDKVTHYPTAKFEGKGSASNMITIGALSWKPDSLIAAPFTNYGKKSIDLFAPGVDIYSTTPENEYKDASGTSMATPVAAGVAAVLKSYYPKLTPEQMKTILIKSSLKTYKGKKVIKPGSKKGEKDRYVKFEELGKNAGLINLYEAIKLADKMNKFKS